LSKNAPFKDVDIGWLIFFTLKWLGISPFHDWVSHFQLTIPHNNVEPLNLK